MPDLLLIGRFLAEHFAALMRWSVWAQAEVAGWTGVADASVAPDVESSLREVVAMFDATAELAGADGSRQGGSDGADHSRFAGGRATHDRHHATMDPMRSAVGTSELSRQA